MNKIAYIQNNKIYEKFYINPINWHIPVRHVCIEYIYKKKELQV